MLKITWLVQIWTSTFCGTCSWRSELESIMGTSGWWRKGIKPLVSFSQTGDAHLALNLSTTVEM